MNCYYSCVPLFTSETAFKALSRRGGLASARYWRERDFESLKRAREARSRYAALRCEWLHATASRQHSVTWFQVPGCSWECDCGLRGDSPEQLLPFHREAIRIEA